MVRSQGWKLAYLMIVVAVSIAISQSVANAQAPAEQTVSVGFSGVPFQQAIDILVRSSSGPIVKFEPSLCAANSQLPDPKKVDIPATVTLSVQNQTFGKALQAILDQSNTPLTFRRALDVYTVVADLSRKTIAKRSAGLPVPGTASFTFTRTPFDEAVDRLFRTYHMRYAIDPDVPFIREGVTLVISNANIDDALTALLSSLSTATTAITSRYGDGGLYTISMREKAPPQRRSSLTGTGGVDLDLSGTRLKAALSAIFRQSHTDYLYVGPLNDTDLITMARFFETQEAACVAILRCAKPHPMRMYRKLGDLVTLLTADPTGDPGPVTVTCHCVRKELGTVAMALFRASHKNLKLNDLLYNSPLTLTLDDVSFEEAINAISRQLPRDSIHIRNGVYEFGK